MHSDPELFSTRGERPYNYHGHINVILPFSSDLSTRTQTGANNSPVMKAKPRDQPLIWACLQGGAGGYDRLLIPAEVFRLRVLQR